MAVTISVHLYKMLGSKAAKFLSNYDTCKLTDFTVAALKLPLYCSNVHLSFLAQHNNSPMKAMSIPLLIDKKE